MPNDGRGSPGLRNFFCRILPGLGALALAAMLVPAGCAAGLPALPGRDAQAAPAAPAGPAGETLDEFTQRLAGAILERDAATLAAAMAPDFHFAEWQERGRILAPDDATTEILGVYLAASPGVTFDTTADVAALLGRDPLTMWPGVNAVGTLYMRGLATDGIADAVLVLAEPETGRYAWAGMLVGPEGFGQSQPAGDAAAATLPARLDILHAVEVFAAPDEGAAQAGVLNFGQVVAVNGASADGGWWQIQCPASVAGECWVQNDPQNVAAVGGALASPAAPPPTIPTATPIVPTATPTVPTATPTLLPPPSPTPVPPTATPAPPERIRFGAGDVSATRQGELGAQQRKQYVLNVMAGQTLGIQIVAPGNAANFAVTGASDGQPYKRLENEDRAWGMVAPRTQDYVITVAALQQTPYTLNIQIPPLAPTPAPTAGPPQRITFGEGQTAAVLDGVLQPGGLDRYLLRAVRGQTMYVYVASDTGFATFGVYGYQDGAVLKRYEVRGDAWSGVLPASQDYLVTVANGGGATTRYSLSISFSPLDAQPPAPAPTERIRFAPGATSATMDGTVAAGGTRSYALGARGGQRMDIRIESPGSLILGIRGANGARLLDPAAGQSSASILLTTTQDYVITVYNVGGESDYALTVAIY